MKKRVQHGRTLGTQGVGFVRAFEHLLQPALAVLSRLFLPLLF